MKEAWFCVQGFNFTYKVFCQILTTGKIKNDSGYHSWSQKMTFMSVILFFIKIKLTSLMIYVG